MGLVGVESKTWVNFKIKGWSLVTVQPGGRGLFSCGMGVSEGKSEKLHPREGRGSGKSFSLPEQSQCQNQPVPRLQVNLALEQGPQAVCGQGGGPVWWWESSVLMEGWEAVQTAGRRGAPHPPHVQAHKGTQMQVPMNHPPVSQPPGFLWG